MDDTNKCEATNRIPKGSGSSINLQILFDNGIEEDRSRETSADCGSSNLNNIETSTLDKVLRIILICFNVIGLTPVKFEDTLVRNCKSFRFLYCICVLIFHLLTIVTECYMLGIALSDSGPRATKKVLKSVGYLLKSFLHVLMFVFFLRYFGKFRDMVEKWRKMERRHQIKYGVDDKWRKRFIIVVITVVTLRLIAWPLSPVMKYIFRRPITFEQYLHKFLRLGRRGFLLAFGDSLLVASYALIMANVSTLDWELLSLCTIVVFELVQARWKLFHQKLSTMAKTSPGDIEWEATRRDYVELGQITESIEQVFSPFVFIYCIYGIYWLLYRIHLGLIGLPYQTFYRTFYFSHTAVLFFWVVMSATYIKETAEEISKVMDTIETKDYNVMAERFESRCRVPIEGITGCKFLYLNRSFINMIIGILFTYEVVLLQISS
ncbi:Uncharacterised protein g1135 [Pycnogonum litorale]